MGLFNRVLHAIRATVTDWVKDQEDPVKLLEQVVEEMREELLKMRQSVAQAIAIQKRNERHIAQNQQTAQTWYDRAQEALKKGDEPLAKQALSHRQMYLETARILQEQVIKQKDLIKRLREDLRILEEKVAQVKTQQDIYLARANSAQAMQRVYEVIGETRGLDTVDLFQRVEDYVIELEAQAELSQSLRSRSRDSE